MKLEMFPLLAISFVVYTALTLIGVPAQGAGGQEVAWYDALVTALPLVSGDIWEIRGGDIFLLVSVGFLFVELVRSTKTGAASIANHLLYFLLFVVVLLCFILVKGFGNSVFFIFMMMTFLDPMAGLVVTTVTARRDLAVADKSGLLN